MTLEHIALRFGYAKKNIGKHFVDYLGPTFFNSLS